MKKVAMMPARTAMARPANVKSQQERGVTYHDG